MEEAASEFLTQAAPQRELETSVQPLKKLTANHLPVIFKSNTEATVKSFGIFHHLLPLTEKFTKSQGAKDLKKLVSVFKEASKNLNFHFLHNVCLKGLSHEIDFKNFDKNLQNLAYLRDAAGF